MSFLPYLACLFAGILLGNALPHFVTGIAGDPFPTPFADPPGKGLSSPTVNVLWALINFVVAFVLFVFGKKATQPGAAMAASFAGFAAISILSSVHFAKKHRT